MDCEPILTKPCRFCLRVAEQNSEIFSDKKTFFWIENKFVECNEILKFLDLSLNDGQHLSPNVPNSICLACKQSIISFYVIKKNFQKNGDALLEKPVKKFDNPVKVKVLSSVKAFLTMNEGKHIKVTHYVNKVVLVAHPASL